MPLPHFSPIPTTASSGLRLSVVLWTWRWVGSGVLAMRVHSCLLARWPSLGAGDSAPLREGRAWKQGLEELPTLRATALTFLPKGLRARQGATLPQVPQSPWKPACMPGVLRATASKTFLPTVSGGRPLSCSSLSPLIPGVPTASPHSLSTSSWAGRMLPRAGISPSGPEAEEMSVT